MIQLIPERKKSFSSFTYKEAFKQLGIIEPERWSIEADPLQAEKLAPVVNLLEPAEQQTLQWTHL